MNGIIEMLQVYYSNYIDNERAGVVSAVQKNKRPLKTFRQRIKGKTGRVRGNLMGKRVNFSGRSVITADPTIDIDEVGVPRSLAKILTFPERVTRFNIKKLTELVAKVIGFNGEIKWDSSKPNGTPRKLLDVSKAEMLGWTYKTELEDGIRLSYEDFLNNPMRAER